MVAMWYAAPDYLRLTMAPTRDRGYDVDAYKIATLELGRKSALGERDIKPWAMLGYYGQQYGKLSWGISRQGAMFQATGGAAEDCVGRKLPFDNVPRLDIQVTCWYEADVPDLAAQLGAKSVAARSGKGGRGWQVRHINGYGRGDTLYLGSRQSELFVRIYDKWRESGDDEYQYAWRYEIELKGKAATAVWALEDRTTPSPSWWAGHVQSAMLARGLTLPLPMEAAASARPVEETEEGIKEKRLAWYRNQVAPSIAKLVASGVGLDEVMEALGIREGTRSIDR